MAVIGITVGGAGLLVAVLTLWVNANSYLLQKKQGSGKPGQKLDPKKVFETLSEVSEDPVRRIAANYIFVESEKKAVGYIDKHPISVYVDLHSATCDPAKRTSLARSLAEFAKTSIGTSIQHASIASPHEGNALLGAAVATQLGCNFLMVRTGRAPRFGYPIEGLFVQGSTAIIVDDLCMEAAFLTKCVTSLRRHGLNISHCVCLYERLDGDAREGLAAVSVTLHSKFQIDDKELQQLQSLAHRDTGLMSYQPTEQENEHR